MNVTINPAASSTLGKGCGTIFFGIFAIMGFVFIVLVGKACFDTTRPYFWRATDCVIESGAVRESPDTARDNGAVFDVRYTYRFDDRAYTGTRFIMGMATGMSAEKAQRAALRYAAGSRATCYVNPSAPAESTLERGAPWLLPFMLIPLVFLAVGVGGIIGVWRVKPMASTPLSELRRSGSGAMLARVLGAIFMTVGGGLVYVMLIHPLLKETAAAKWPQVPCEIISSRVASHLGSEGGSTYSIEIRYRYEFKGRTYTGTRHNFSVGSASGREWRDAVVAKFPPRLRTVCYVNPDDPIEAVLSVKASSDRWFGLIPGLFFIVGLFVFLKAPAMAKAGASRTGLPDDILPLLKRDLVTGGVELKPASTPVGGFLALLVFALIWNGITWGILFTIPRGDWFPRIFLGIFALIGAALIVGVAYQFLALFNPRPILTAGAGAIPLGGTLDVRWRFTGNVRRLTKLEITLEGREEATYRRGTTTSTDRSVFARLPLVETCDRAQFGGGSAKVAIPRDLTHTFTAPNNKILWTLRVAGTVPKWPDMGAEFPITVLPREAATLFREEKPTT